LTDLDDILAPSRIVLFPVRHHSPTAARIVRDLICRVRPAAVLIEGPSDFNDRLDELALDHELPIAIYSYLRVATGQRRGAYYPFCDHSPEWQALSAGRAAKADVRFIDLPFGDVAGEDDHANRYADAELRRGAYVRSLCAQLGVDGFDGLWDALIEAVPDLSEQDYLKRVHHLCGHIRLLEGCGRLSDRRREAFMARQIRLAAEACDGPIIVVTGGYHSIALHHRLVGRAAVEGMLDPPDALPQADADGSERGIALTPYSYERLDGLHGYNAGMPNPGFYDRLWHDREAGRSKTYRGLLSRVARTLRDRKQRVSSADLIAAETCALGLARLRGRSEAWRSDLLDGVLGALVKDELAIGGAHPLLSAIHEILRGDRRGRLAEGTALPPLVHDLRAQLSAHRLLPDQGARAVELELASIDGRQASMLLHRMRLLEIAGFTRSGGTDFGQREDLTRLWEKWEIAWSPDFDSSSVECARYGTTVEEATTARLLEKARGIERSAQQGAALLLDASLAGLHAVAGDLHDRVVQLVREDPTFLSLSAALGHLLYLYRYDEVLGTTGRQDVGAVLLEAFARSLWLLETLGQVAGDPGPVVTGVARLIDTFDRCSADLALNWAELVDVLGRVRGDRGQSPAVRGAAVGALWRLSEADAVQVEADLRRFSDPDQLGDFLTGLFSLARELVQRDRGLILSIDALLGAFEAEQFLTALPSLRLAFTYFTPREKHHLALNLRTALRNDEPPAAGDVPMAALEVSPAQAARALALEARLDEALRRYGLRSMDGVRVGGDQS